MQAPALAVAGLCFLIPAASIGQPQAASARPAFDSFEVATVKPTGPNPAGRWIRMQSANLFEARNHALKTLIAAAYDVSPAAISGGPAWVDSDHWDIRAKTPGDVLPTLPEQMKMLRSLLAERFQLSFHRESKAMSVYQLSVPKGGQLDSRKPRPPENSFADAPAGPPPLIFILAPGDAKLPGRSASIAELASTLQRAVLDRPVIDQTGLSGRYDFDLEFMPDPGMFGGSGLSGTPESVHPDLFAAMQQQLGLKLEAARGPVPAIVIDRAQRPSAN